MATNTNKRSVRTYKKKDTTASSTYPSSMAGNSYSAAISNSGNSGSTYPSSMAGNSYSAALKNAASSNTSAAVKSALSGAVGNSSYTLPTTPSVPEVPEVETNYQSGYSLPASMPTLSELPTFNSEYLDQLNALANRLTQMNYEDWTQGDQYKTLANRYGDMGKMSMQDVLGQIAGRTGGLASSYATSAAQQQYNDYMTQLEDVARSLYSSDRNDMMNDFSTLRNLYTDEYQRYRDTVEDEYQRYRDQVSDYLNMLSLQKSGSGSSSGSSKATSAGSITTPVEALKAATAKSEEDGTGNTGTLTALRAMRDTGVITDSAYNTLNFVVKSRAKKNN